MGEIYNTSEKIYKKKLTRAELLDWQKATFGLLKHLESTNVPREIKTKKKLEKRLEWIESELYPRM